jgi:hypothetical protein
MSVGEAVGTEITRTRITIATVHFEEVCVGQLRYMLNDRHEPSEGQPIDCTVGVRKTFFDLYVCQVGTRTTTAAAVAAAAAAAAADTAWNCRRSYMIELLSHEIVSKNDLFSFCSTDETH